MKKDDLTRQIKCVKLKYLNYKLISDIESGINFNKKNI
jgi:predicted site-specific integrase-resolvase